MPLSTHLCTPFRDGSLFAAHYRFAPTFISLVPSLPKLVCTGKLVHREFIYLHSWKKTTTTTKISHLWYCFHSTELDRQCFLLLAFSESLPIVFYALRICERKLECIVFSKHTMIWDVFLTFIYFS